MNIDELKNLLNKKIRKKKMIKASTNFVLVTVVITAVGAGVGLFIASKFGKNIKRNKDSVEILKDAIQENIETIKDSVDETAQAVNNVIEELHENTDDISEDVNNGYVEIKHDINENVKNIYKHIE